MAMKILAHGFFVAFARQAGKDGRRMNEFMEQLQAGGPDSLDLSALNADQLAAVTAPGAGPALVLAGAGSGKTRTLTYRVAWLISQGVKPWQILLLTFTNKAAREMLGRVEDLTSLTRWGDLWGGTFHSVGQRFLRMHGGVVGLGRNFTILDADDAEALLADVVRAKDPAFFKRKEHPKASVLEGIFSYARNTRRNLAELVQDKYPWLEEMREQMEAFYAGYAAAKLEKQVVDYDDLLEFWLKVLQKDEVVRGQYQRRFQHILVDEYQDTNKLQSDIVELLANNHQLMAVGDDAQCIYTWRGAHFENILHFEDRHPGAQIYKIETNYRSSPEILAFANGILMGQPEGMGYRKELRAVRSPHRKPVVIAALDGQQQAQLVIARIRELRDNDGLALHDIAVLYRAHFQAMDLQLELSRAGVPFTITSGVRFFEQAHIRDLVAHVRFAHNPRDTVAFTRLASLLPKVGPHKAAAMLTTAADVARRAGKSLISALTDEKVLGKAPPEARGDLKDLALTLQNLEEALAAAGVAQLHPGEEIENSKLKIQNEGADRPGALAQSALFEPEEDSELKIENSKTKSAAKSVAPGARRVVATPQEVMRLAIEGWYGDYLRNIYDNWQSRREDLDGLIGFAGRFGDLNELLAQLALLNSETSNRGADVPADTIRLTTIHQAKGLEYPVVFLIGVADGLLPLKRAIDEGDVEEERRLFYVGSTRARDELYILYPRITTQGGPPTVLEPSRFIQELNPDTYDQFKARGRY